MLLRSVNTADAHQHRRDILSTSGLTSAQRPLNVRIEISVDAERRSLCDVRAQRFLDVVSTLKDIYRLITDFYLRWGDLATC